MPANVNPYDPHGLLLAEYFRKQVKDQSANKQLDAGSPGPHRHHRSRRHEAPRSSHEAPHSSHQPGYMSMGPVLSFTNPFDHGSTISVDEQPTAGSVGPDRHPRTRVRPEAPGSTYHASRANSSQPPRPVTPPNTFSGYDGSPETPPRKHSIDFWKTTVPRQWKHSPGKGGVRILPDKPVAIVPYVSHRGSVMPTDENGKPRKARPFIFDHGRQVDPQVACPNVCAHFQFMHEESFKLRKGTATLAVKQPAPIQPYQASSFIVFTDRRVAVDFPGQGSRGCGVLLRDVLDPPDGFSLVDDDEVVNPSNADALFLNIAVNGYPTALETIHLRCAHGRVTRYGLLRQVAKKHYHIMHMSVPATRTSKHHNKALPKKVAFERLRLVSLYTHDHAFWNAEFIYVSDPKSKRSACD
ncbi:uncharacterized protein BT62DRAFT_385406 [Guyanagaster necrorhizus]|uniref:Uncharacterized protein n=1 Tax=Guyanagaster necrorhizus TaxID=856835 RepID=A0A9P8AP25_9AGAR|nr:uncharacterized protein BT62DRAFT_385406 [Guyanagaster necrorhizus MCA 3950]KAG7442504.1 hypothetical protein BT62DRAFT_385406 [Guyanagaster necrorhizus MCA 3950]